MVQADPPPSSLPCLLSPTGLQCLSANGGEFMAALPVTPLPTPEPVAALSEPARIINTFVAPSKTFTDLRRSAAWWGPFLIMTIVALGFVYVVDQKIGF